MIIKNMHQIIVIVVGLMVSTNLRAVVVYDYHELTESSGGYSFSGQIIFSEQAYLSGSVSGSIDFFSLCYSINPDTGEVVIECQESDVLSISMLAVGGTYGSFSMNWFAPFEFNPYESTLYYDFVFDDTLSGSFFWFNSYITDLAMSGNSTWNIDNAGSDVIQASCAANDPNICSGATGMWVLDNSSIPVAEPTALWFFCLGALLLIRYGRYLQWGTGVTKL